MGAHRGCGIQQLVERGNLTARAGAGQQQLALGPLGRNHFQFDPVLVDQHQPVCLGQHGDRLALDNVDHHRVGQLPRHARIFHPRKLQQAFAQVLHVDEWHGAVPVGQGNLVNLQLVQVVGPPHVDVVQFEPGIVRQGGDLIASQGRHSGQGGDDPQHNRHQRENPAQKDAVQLLLGQGQPA